MKLTSTAFWEGAAIPKPYTGDGRNISPPLQWQELAIFPALLVLAVIVGLVPGLTAYRADVAKGLSD